MKPYFQYIGIAVSLAIASVPAIAQQLGTPQNNIPDGSQAATGTITYPGLNNLSGISLYNYVRTRVPDVPVQDMSSLSHVREVTNFFDGLGRPLQTVAKKAHAEGYDIVQQHVYDSLGRETYQYLPYAYESNGLNTPYGQFHPAALTDVTNFYDGSPGEQPYGKTVFDNSPLNRVSRQLSPGRAWVGSDRSVNTFYGSNEPWTVADPNNPLNTITVTGGYPRWTIGDGIGALPQYMGDYTPGDLYSTKVIDEDGKISEEFKDKEGRVVIRRSLVNPMAGIKPELNRAPSDYYYTSYVYDAAGRLRCVIPPKAMVASGGSYTQSWSITAAMLDGLCFQYVYDGRNRLIEKKIPGKDPEYYVYDQRDRQVLYQDGNLRNHNNWTYTIYDVANRPVSTGIYNTQDAGIPRTTMQGYLDDGNTYATGGNMGLFGYLKNYSLYHVYPETISYCKPLSFTYYDDYAQLGSFSYDANQFSAVTFPTDGTVVTPAMTALTRSLVTGGKTRVMDPDDPNGTTWLRSVNYYDDKGRLIQNQSENIKGGMDLSSNSYYFQGKVWKNIVDHHNPNAQPLPGAGDQLTEQKVVTTYNLNLTADGGNDQVRTITQKINSGIEYPFAGYSYDHMSRVTTKQFPAGTVKQRYNVRGFLDSISVVNNTADLDSLNIFDEGLYYDHGFGSKLYNGNIAGITWRKAGASAPYEAYGYSYDPLNRLSHAEYRRKESSWTSQHYNYTASNITYDLNGNLMSMNQMGPNPLPGQLPIAMDQLSYTYPAGSNQLSKVADQVSATNTQGLPDFKDGTNTDDDYTYDANGNLDRDKNKSISSITYNYLNKPEVITVDGKGTLTYVYDAAGNRLRKTVTPLSGPAEVYDYIGNFVYKNDTLQYMLNAEGRARPVVTASTSPVTKFVYDYFAKDHLGNVRSTVTATPMNESYLASMEIGAANLEQLFFDNVGTTRGTKPGSTNPNDHMAALLDGGDPNRRIGPAIMLQAMPGDRFEISVDGFYDGMYQQDQEISPDALIESLTSTLLGGQNYEGVPLSELPDNVKTIQTALGNSALPGQLDALMQADNNTNAPKAHLNILFFDDQMNLVPGASRILQVAENPNGLGQWVTLHPEGTSGSGGSSNTGVMAPCCTSPGPGFILVYVDNQSIGQEVWFDNLTIGHYSGSVVEENHYYPFGLTLNLDQNSSVIKNDFKFQNQRHENDFGVNMYCFKYREHDPEIGRSWQIDPLADKYVYNSTYAFSENKVTRHIELEGLEGIISPLLMGENGVWVRPSFNLVEETPPVAEQLVEQTTDVGGKSGKFTPEQLDNFRRGNQVEAEQLAKRGLTKNTKPHDVEVDGKVKRTVPDAIDEEGKVWEVKNVKRQGYTRQLKAEEKISLENGKNPGLIINKDAQLSKPLQNSSFDIEFYQTLPPVPTNDNLKVAPPVQVEPDSKEPKLKPLLDQNGNPVRS